MKKRKIRPGACGICGAPLPIPTAEAISQGMTRYARSECPAPCRAWIDGHLYEMDDATGNPRLRKVRCHKHADKNDFDPRVKRAGEWM